MTAATNNDEREGENMDKHDGFKLKSKTRATFGTQALNTGGSSCSMADGELLHFTWWKYLLETQQQQRRRHRQQRRRWWRGALLADACEVHSLLFHAFLGRPNGCTGPSAFTLGWRRHGNKIQGVWVSRWSLQINKQLVTLRLCATRTADP